MWGEKMSKINKSQSCTSDLPFIIQLLKEFVKLSPMLFKGFKEFAVENLKDSSIIPFLTNAILYTAFPDDPELPRGFLDIEHKENVFLILKETSQILEYIANELPNSSTRTLSIEPAQIASGDVCASINVLKDAAELFFRSMFIRKLMGEQTGKSKIPTKTLLETEISKILKQKVQLLPRLFRDGKLFFLLLQELENDLVTEFVEIFKDEPMEETLTIKRCNNLLDYLAEKGCELFIRAGNLTTGFEEKRLLFSLLKLMVDIPISESRLSKLEWRYILTRELATFRETEIGDLKTRIEELKKQSSKGILNELVTTNQTKRMRSTGRTKDGRVLPPPSGGFLKEEEICDLMLNELELEKVSIPRMMHEVLGPLSTDDTFGYFLALTKSYFEESVMRMQHKIGEKNSKKSPKHKNSEKTNLLRSIKSLEDELRIELSESDNSLETQAKENNKLVERIYELENSLEDFKNERLEILYEKTSDFLFQELINEKKALKAMEMERGKLRWALEQCVSKIEELKSEGQSIRRNLEHYYEKIELIVKEDKELREVVRKLVREVELAKSSKNAIDLEIEKLLARKSRLECGAALQIDFLIVQKAKIENRRRQLELTAKVAEREEIENAVQKSVGEIEEFKELRDQFLNFKSRIKREIMELVDKGDKFSIQIMKEYLRLERCVEVHKEEMSGLIQPKL